MTKKDYIALADEIREHQSRREDVTERFSLFQLESLALMLQNMNHNFMRQRWLDYIAGECGPNGGAVRLKDDDAV